MFDFIRRTRVNVPIINILLPAPGTRVFERLDQEGRLLVRNEDDYLRNALSYAISCSHCLTELKLHISDMILHTYIYIYIDVCIHILDICIYTE